MLYDVVHTIIEIGVRDVFRTDIAGQQWRSCDFWSKGGLRSLSPDEVRRNRLVSNMIEEAVLSHSCRQHFARFLGIQTTRWNAFDGCC